MAHFCEMNAIHCFQCGKLFRRGPIMWTLESAPKQWSSAKIVEDESMPFEAAFDTYLHSVSWGQNKFGQTDPWVENLSVNLVKTSVKEPMHIGFLLLNI